MHKFLSSIGFTNCKKKDLDTIVRSIIENPDEVRTAKNSEGNQFVELIRMVADDIGLSVRGTYLDDGSFEMEYLCPFFYGESVTTQEEVDVERNSERESYAGVCDDANVGVSMIFYLLNVVDYLSRSGINSQGKIYGACLSGLSIEGKILLPIYSREEKTKAGNCRFQERNQLVAQAREGNEEAIESLTLEDMDIYSMISRRVVNEDVLSIVNTTFIPYGIESDKYSIVAEILDVNKVTNSITNEQMYKMKVSCNDLVFDILINERNLVGEPAVGRRFKGNIWMQGSVCL
ncbi:MAG: DUF3881 family protein [Agathobacter sp.]|nr:DUF3881 family protein [Agathobacter sp.]